MNFKTPLCSHIYRFMVIVSKMRDGKYMSLCYKISVFYFERVFHSCLMSQAPESYIIEYPQRIIFSQFVVCFYFSIRPLFSYVLWFSLNFINIRHSM